MRQPGNGVTSVRSRRQSPAPERRRGDLLDAATALFSAKGIEATSVADITAAAGVAKGSFYRYFDSREALVAALKTRFIDDLLAEVAGFADRIGSADRDGWWVLVDDFVAAMVDALLARRDLIRIFSAQPGSDDTVDLFVAGEDRIDEFIAAGIQVGVDAGVFTVADPPMTATLLQHAISATVEHAIVHNVAVDRGRLVSAAQRLVRAALEGS